MTFDDYQKQAIKFDMLGDGSSSINAHDPAFVAKILGLVGESGEVAEKFKKIIRDNQGKLSSSDKEEILKELGDVVWYISAITHYLGESFDKVATQNISKLSSRKARGVQSGKGDNR